MNSLYKTYQFNIRSKFIGHKFTSNIKSLLYTNKFLFSFEQEKKETKRHFTLNYKYIEDVYYKRSKRLL